MAGISGATGWIGVNLACTDPPALAKFYADLFGWEVKMVHLDIGVTDLTAAVNDAADLGAQLADFQPQDDVRVMLDPDGHPFCLYLDQA